MAGAKKRKRILVTGASGFIGRALIPALAERSYGVRAASRNVRRVSARDGVDWIECDLLRSETLRPAFEGVACAYYLVHSMGRGHADYRDRDRRAAHAFVAAAEEASIERIVYLGGVAPSGPPSEHLASRLEVGEILRSGSVPAIELRASMIIGPGSASWQIVRDLAMRLPAMVLPQWLQSRTQPVALDDVIAALVAAAEIPLAKSEVYNLPGPETLSAKDILLRVGAITGRSIPSILVPVLTPRLSAMWLRLVTRADYSIARELVLGLQWDPLESTCRHASLSIL